MTGFDRRRALAALGALPYVGWPLGGIAAETAAWPERPVHIVSPIAPGGPNDVSARIIAERLQQRFQVPFLVENRPGAATRIGNEFVARASADGATLLYAAAALAVLPSLYADLSYDWQRDLAPVTLAVMAPLFLVVRSDLALRDVRDFVAMAQRSPNGVTFAGPGVATVPHLLSELLVRKLGIPGRTINFRGDAAAIVELLAGRVDASCMAATAALPYVQQGKLRIIAVAANERSTVYPAAPTLLEQGVNDVAGSAWFGFLAPARSAPAMVERMHAAIAAVLAEPAVREALARSGLQAVGNRPEEFATFIGSEARKWAAVVKDAKIKAE